MNPIKGLTLHSDVELTESEIADALIKAKSDKASKILKEESDKKRRQANDELMKPFDYLELIEYCKRFYEKRLNKPFEIDQRNETIVRLLALYFTVDKRFEQDGEYSLSKGILIMGNVGSGKTELMRFFQKNKRQCFTLKPCKDIANDYDYYKGDVDEVYSTPIEKPLHDPSVFFQKFIGYCFDDLGTEEVKNNYGNKKNVMADVIMAIYDKKDYTKWFMTTNLSGKDEIIERYGTRVNSRLREIFNVFVLNCSDRRK